MVIIAENDNGFNGNRDGGQSDGIYGDDEGCGGEDNVDDVKDGFILVA